MKRGDIVTFKRNRSHEKDPITKVRPGDIGICLDHSSLPYCSLGSAAKRYPEDNCHYIFRDSDLVKIGHDEDLLFQMEDSDCL